MAAKLPILRAPDPMNTDLLHRIPVKGHIRIQPGSVCLVQEYQVAVFMNNHGTTEVLGPGRHVLTGKRLSDLGGKKDGSRRRKSVSLDTKILFVNQNVLSGIVWELEPPLSFTDRKLGTIELKARGIYSLRVADPGLLARQLETRGVSASAEIWKIQNDLIVTRMISLFRDRLTSLAELTTLYSELATEARLLVKEDLAQLGICLIDFFITTVAPALEYAGEAENHPLGLGARIPIPSGPVEPGPGTSPNDPGSGSAGVGPSGGLGLVWPEALTGTSAGREHCPRCGSRPGPPCPGCGLELPAKARFCSDCGMDLDKSEVG